MEPACGGQRQRQRLRSRHALRLHGGICWKARQEDPASAPVGGTGWSSHVDPGSPSSCSPVPGEPPASKPGGWTALGDSVSPREFWPCWEGESFPLLTSQAGERRRPARFHRTHWAALHPGEHKQGPYRSNRGSSNRPRGYTPSSQEAPSGVGQSPPGTQCTWVSPALCPFLSSNLSRWPPTQDLCTCCPSAHSRSARFCTATDTPHPTENPTLSCPLRATLLT